MFSFCFQRLQSLLVNIVKTQCPKPPVLTCTKHHQSQCNSVNDISNCASAASFSALARDRWQWRCFIWWHVWNSKFKCLWTEQTIVVFALHTSMTPLLLCNSMHQSSCYDRPEKDRQVTRGVYRLLLLDPHYEHHDSSFIHQSDATPMQVQIEEFALLR